MKTAELTEKLLQAQALMGEVYFHAIQHNQAELENLMSHTDNCVIEALELLEDVK